MGGPPPFVPPQAAPVVPRKKRHGCRSCCLFTLLTPLVLILVLLVVGWIYFSEPANPVEKEYDSVPDYYSRLITADDIPSTIVDTAGSAQEDQHG